MERNTYLSKSVVDYHLHGWYFLSSHYKHLLQLMLSNVGWQINEFRNEHLLFLGIDL